MRRAWFWLRWSWRDLRGRWLVVMAIALVIAIGTGAYSGLGSLETWRVESNDASFSSLHSHSVRVSLTEGSYARKGRIAAALDRLPGGQVEAAQERLVLPTQVDASGPGRSILTPGRIVGIDVGAPEPLVDGVAASAGRTLRSQDSGRPVGVLEANFAEFHELPDAGSIRLAGGRPLRYVGQGRSPEYFYVTTPGGGDFGAEANYAVVFTSLRTAEKLAGRPRAVNELVVRLRPGADEEAFQAELERALHAVLPGAGVDLTPISEEPSYRVLYKDAQGDQRVFNIFAYLILLGAAFAAFNLASRIVEAQRREIGIGMALGVPPARLAIRPLLLGVEIAIAGTVLGVVIGLFVADLLRGVLGDLLPLPEIRTPLELPVFIRGAALGMVLPLVATAIPVLRAVRVQPVEAIRVGFRSVKSGGAVAHLKRIPLPGRSLAQMPVRNVARTPRRTAMTVLGIAAVVTVIAGFLGMVDSFLGASDQAEAVAAGDSPERVVVQMDDFYAAGSGPIRRVERSPAVGASQGRLTLPGRLDAGGEGFDAVVELLPAGGSIWHPEATSGELAHGSRGIMLSEEAASDLGVGVGDEVTLTHPRAGGAGDLAIAETALPVSGLDANPFRNFAYMDISQAGLMGLSGRVNGLDVLPAPGRSPEDVKRALFRMPGVASVEAATASTELLRDRMKDFVNVFRTFELFCLVLAFLIAFNSSSINADERARESATMFAFGVPVRKAIRVSVLESLIMGVLGTVLGVALGVAVVGWVVNVVTPDTLPDLGVEVTISPTTLLAAAAVGVAAVAVAPLLTVRRLRRMDIPSTLRVVE